MDAVLDHAVADDFEHEAVARNEVLGQREHVFHVFDGQARLAGGDGADDRHMDDRPSPADGVPRPAPRRQFDGAGQHGIALDMPLLFQRLQVRVDRGGRRQVDGLPDLADGRRVAMRVHMLLDIEKNLFLSCGKWFRHRVFAPECRN